MVHEGSGADVIQSVQVAVEPFRELGHGAVVVHPFHEGFGGLYQGVVLSGWKQPDKLSGLVQCERFVHLWEEDVVQIQLIGRHRRIAEFPAFHPGQKTRSIQPRMFLNDGASLVPGISNKVLMVAVGQHMDGFGGEIFQ